MVKTQLCVVKPSKILGLGQWDGVIYESKYPVAVHTR